MEEPPTLGHGGGLMALLTAMDAGRAAGPGGSAKDGDPALHDAVQHAAAMRGPVQVEPIPGLGEDVQTHDHLDRLEDGPVHSGPGMVPNDQTQDVHEHTPVVGFSTPQKNSIHSTSEEVVAARDRCSVVGITQQEDLKVVLINDGSMRDRVVHWSTTNIFGSCSCKLFEKMGVPCRHIIVTLRGEKLYELPSCYILKRWETRCKREIVFDEEGNLLDEKPIDANEAEKRRKIATVRNKVEDLIQRAKTSDEGMNFLISGVQNIEDSLGHIVPSTVQTTQEEYEGSVGCKIPENIQIHPPNDVRSKGRSKRIKSAKELAKPRRRKNATNETKEPPHQ